MSSILDHKANFATDGERVPRSKADRIRTMGRVEPRTFSDSTHPFSAIDTKRKNRFQKDYVGIAPGDSLAKERRTGREPPSHQNIKYEDDNVRFLATGERLRQANPSDRAPRRFELSTQRVQRLNVFPDGTPRSGFPADVNLEAMQNAEFKSALGQLVTDFKNLPLNIAAANAGLVSRPAPVQPAQSATPTENLYSGLKGLFGSDTKSIDIQAENVSIRSAEGRLQQLQTIRGSSDFKKTAEELAQKLGAKINIKKDTREEIDKALSERLDIIKRTKEERARAAQINALNRRASIDSQISESELKQLEPVLFDVSRNLEQIPPNVERETKSGAVSPAGSVKGASPAGSVQGAAAQAQNVQDAINELEKLKNSVMTGLKDVFDQDRVKELLKVLQSAGYISNTTDIDTLNNAQAALIYTSAKKSFDEQQTKGKSPSPKSASPKGPSPKGPSPKASPKAGEETKDDPAEVINEMIKNIQNKSASNIDEEANILGISRVDILEYHKSPEKEKELIQKLEEVRDDGLTYLNMLSMYNSLSEDKKKGLPSFIANFLNVNEDLVSKNLIAGESGIKDIEDAIKSKLDGQIVELFPPTQITTSTVARIDDIFKQISLTGTVSDYRLADSQRYLKATYDYLKDFSAWKGMTKEEAEKAYESFKNRFKEPPIPRSKINGKPLANQTQSAKRYLTIERVFKSAIKNNGELKQKTFYSAFGTVSIPPVS